MRERERNNRQMVYLKTDTGFSRYRAPGDPIYFEWFMLTDNMNRSLWKKILQRTICVLEEHTLDKDTIVETGIKDGRHYDIGMCKVCRIRLLVIENRTWKGPYAYGG